MKTEIIEIAKRDSRENYPIDNPKKIKIELSFTLEQYQKIKYGLVPKEMEDKWFIFFEDDYLYIHRSWTGYGIYKAKIETSENKYVIREFYVERNKSKYTNKNDEEDIKTFSSLITRGLLNIP